jgi:hypothetical protein
MDIPAPSEPVRQLRCDRCDCVLDLTVDELLRCSHGDWPRCCMMAMILEVDEQSVRPNDKTELERGRRQGRRRVPG